MRTRLASVATAILLAATALAGSAGTALMATPVTFTSAPFTLVKGTSTSPSIDITAQYTAGYTGYAEDFDTSNWSSTDTLSCTIQFSPDNGVTWGWGGSMTTSGGVHTTSKGTVWGCGVSSALPGTAAWPTPDGWPANPATVQVRMLATVPSRQTTTLRVSLM